MADLIKEPQGRLSGRRAPGGAGSAEASAPGNGIADDRTLPLVREQLLLLNTGVLSYRGEAWPGQEMAITVQERGVDEEPGVEATLALELPSLGGVQARLQIGAQGMVLELVTQRPESCEVLKAGASDLMAAQRVAGVHLARVSVRHAEEGE